MQPCHPNDRQKQQMLRSILFNLDYPLQETILKLKMTVLMITLSS